MKKIKLAFSKTLVKIGKKLIQIFGISSIMGTFGSCLVAYGMPEPYDYPSMYGTLINYNFTGRVLGDIDKDGTAEPVKDIKVTLTCTNAQNEKTNTEVKTDEDGKYKINVREGYGWGKEAKYSYEVTFEDVDGDQNGSFKSKTLEAGYSDSYNAKSVDLGETTLENK